MFSCISSSVETNRDANNNARARPHTIKLEMRGCDSMGSECELRAILLRANINIAHLSRSATNTVACCVSIITENVASFRDMDHLRSSLFGEQLLEENCLPKILGGSKLIYALPLVHALSRPSPNTGRKQVDLRITPPRACILWECMHYIPFFSCCVCCRTAACPQCAAATRTSQPATRVPRKSCSP